MTLDQPSGLPERRRPVHHVRHDAGNRSTIIFLTACTRDRRPVLVTDAMHQSIRNAWLKATYWLIGRYMIMPDHIHLFCAPGTIPPEPLEPWIAYWKRLVAFDVGGSLWQKNSWDTQLRSHESYAKKWEYVRNNPVRAGLVSQPEDWPFQGEINVLPWHDR